MQGLAMWNAPKHDLSNLALEPEQEVEKYVTSVVSQMILTDSFPLPGLEFGLTIVAIRDSEADRPRGYGLTARTIAALASIGADVDYDLIWLEDGEPEQ